MDLAGELSYADAQLSIQAKHAFRQCSGVLHFCIRTKVIHGR